MKIDWPGPFRYRPPKLSYVRTPEHLLIAAIEGRWQNLLTGNICLVFAILYLVFHLHSFRTDNIAWPLALLGLAAWSFYIAKHPDIATVEITRLAVKARSRWSSAEMMRADIGQLHFLAGDGENGQQGLYASKGWSHALLLPYVTEDQVFEIKNEIYQIFPDTPSGIAKPVEVITLGLNR